MRSIDQTGTARETDGHLLARLQAGDAEAFDALFARHRRGLLAYAEAILGDRAAAEDITQEAFTALARHADEIDPHRGPTAWLYRVARNRAIDRRRHGAWETTPGDKALAMRRDEEGAEPSASENVMARERDAAVRRALASLPEAERDVLTMRYFGGLTFREVGRALRQPLGTVLWRAHRGLGRLREMV
jgi:RNA polymerase sigma-70 factor (ECF subfamily)